MKYLIIFLSILTFLNCKVKDGNLRINDYNISSQQQNMTIDVHLTSDLKVGTIDGIIPFETNTKDEEGFFDDSDIETKTKFDLQIESKKNHTYNTNCRLWKDSRNSIVIFCDMKEALIEDDEFSLSTTKDIKYNSKDVRIIFNINSFMLRKFEGNLPLIYSKSQNFNITEDTKIITLNFKIGSFNFQHLFLEIHKQGIIF